MYTKTMGFAWQNAVWILMLESILQWEKSVLPCSYVHQQCGVWLQLHDELACTAEWDAGRFAVLCEFSCLLQCWRNIFCYSLNKWKLIQMLMLSGVISVRITQGILAFKKMRAVLHGHTVSLSARANKQLFLSSFWLVVKSTRRSCCIIC